MSETNRAATAAGSQSFQLLAVARLVKDAFGRRVEQVGLGAEEAMITAAVLEAPGCTLDDLAPGLSWLPPEAAARFAAGLVADGTLHRDAEDRLWPTQAAETLRPLLTATAERIDALATRDLDPVSCQAVLYLLSRIASNLRADGAGGSAGGCRAA